MTPRQIEALLSLAMRREARHMAQSLSVNALAARGEPSALKKQISKLAG